MSLTEQRLRDILERITTVSVGVVGDFCVDAYWEFDASHPEASIETGKFTHAVSRQRYSPGGAGNIVSNVVALGATSVHAFGVIGGDLFGREMQRMLTHRSVNTDGIIIQPPPFDTPVYAKPFLNDEEQERIDFGRFNAISGESSETVIRSLRHALPHLSALIINQQLLHGVCSEKMLETLNNLALEFPEKIFIADSRHRAHLIHHMIRKLNAAEAAASNQDKPLKEHIVEIATGTSHPAFITRGEKGILACDGSSVYEIPAIHLSGRIDTVGAGDTTIAAIACSLAAGASVREAAEVGNLAAAVTVQKVGQTGTASPREIIEVLRPS